MVTQIGMTTTYQITGLDNETAATGNYVLSVNGALVEDANGDAGTGIASVSWTNSALAGREHWNSN